MMKFEELERGNQIRGTVPNQIVTIVDVEWAGQDAITVVYRRENGKVEDVLLFRDSESHLELVQAERLWPFDADGGRFRLASEAYRIQLAYLFDPHAEAKRPQRIEQNLRLFRMTGAAVFISVAGEQSPAI